MEKLNKDKKRNSFSPKKNEKNCTINVVTIDKVRIGKSIIERKYLQKETQYMKNAKLYNTIINYFNNISNLSENEKEEIKNKIFLKISQCYRISRQKITKSRFEILRIIGKGGFGNVKLCKDKITNEIYAMKKIKLKTIINKAQLLHIKTERDILAATNYQTWKSNLNYCFIEKNYLYFIMDFYPGGDLLEYMKKTKKISEEEAKFFIAEIILGVEDLHKNKCMHRDIKPENILIDKDGHLKLGDFGLSSFSNEALYPYTYKKEGLRGISKCGSLLYMAPEMLQDGGYGSEVDWWSVGIIFYEMLVGFPPFFTDKPEDIINRLNNFKEYLKIPIEANVSENAKKLIFDFLQDSKNRLGKNGINEIKGHIFFKGFDWENIRRMKPPYIPEKINYTENYIKTDKLKIYTSKEKINNTRFEANTENKEEILNLNIYDFYYNKELEQLKYDIENNIKDIIQNEIDNYINKIDESQNGNNENTSKDNFLLSKKYLSNSCNKVGMFQSFENLLDKKKLKKKKDTKKIDIIPLRNLINNMQVINKKDRFNSALKNRSIFQNKFIRESENTTEHNSMKKDIIKKKKKIDKNNQKEEKKLKINGKLVMVKKNLSKYY
jgi:serine/threonine kinase 38